MADTQPNGHRSPRLDQLEKLMDLLITDHLAFSDEHKQLLTSQVILTDRLDKLAITVKELGTKTDERLNALKQEIAELQKDSDERLNSLIRIVDQLVRDSGGKASN